MAKYKDLAACSEAIDLEIMVRTEERTLVRGTIEECTVSWPDKKKPLWKIVVRANEKYVYVFETVELMMWLEDKVEDVKATTFLERAVEAEVAMFSPGFEGCPRVNTW